MSQTALYQVLSVHGYRVTKTERVEKKLLLSLEPQPHRIRCSACGGRVAAARKKK